MAPFRDTNLQIKSLFPSPLNDVELGRAGVPGCEVVGAVSQRLLIGFSAAEKGCRPLEATWPTCSNPCHPSVRSFPSYPARLYDFRIDGTGLLVVTFPRMLSSVVTNPREKDIQSREKRERRKEIKKVTFSGREKRKDPPAASYDFSLDFHVHFLIPRLAHIVLD